MAIQVEQERKSINWLSMLLVAVIVIVLFAGTYLLFFKTPETIEIIVPGQFEDIQKISQLRFNPQELIASPEFKLLKQFAVDISPPTPGRVNPFAPY